MSKKTLNVGGYLICKNGNILSKKTGKPLKTETTTGYKRVKLYLFGKKQNFLVHRIIAFAFIPNPQRKPFVNHIDGNKLNNNISNLEWVTNKENILHASIHMLNKKKLNIEQVQDIRNSEKSYRYLSKKYNCSTSTIHDIKKEKTWKNQTKTN